jgi:hypothetical protein
MYVCEQAHCCIFVYYVTTVLYIALHSSLLHCSRFMQGWELKYKSHSTLVHKVALYHTANVALNAPVVVNNCACGAQVFDLVGVGGGGALVDHGDGALVLRWHQH